MSKKKQQRNGFFYFMLDMQQELRERGRNVPMHSMSAIAGPRWATMSDAQRQAYNQRAKSEKATARGTGATTSSALMPPVGNSVPRYERMDCTGQKLSVSLIVQLQSNVDYPNPFGPLQKSRCLDKLKLKFYICCMVNHAYSYFSIVAVYRRLTE